MYSDKIPLHQTETIPTDELAGNTWEFVCDQCSFRARYTQGQNRGENRLEILNMGDPQARHMANRAPMVMRPQDRIGSLGHDCTDDEAWLTPELRKKLGEILQGLD